MKKVYKNDEILYEVIDAISSLEIGEVLTRVDKLISKITNADSTGIYTLDEKTESVVLRASKLHFEIVGKLKMNLGEGITGWVAKYGKIVVVEKNADKDARFQRVTDLPDDLYESFLSVPIKSGDVIVGVINIKHKKPHEYDKEQVKLIETIGKLIGRAVEYTDLLEKTKNLIETIATQKAVNRAKGILIESKKICENDAYHAIRRQATRERKTLREIAEAIITASQIDS